MKILYVDDEPDIRDVAVMALEIDPDLEVKSASSGGEALSMLDESGYRPDVVLLDVMMPVMDGPAVLEALRKRPEHAETPVVFITARAQAHETARFLSLGAVGVITKPFDPMTLALELRAILSRAAG
ncbi:response regulator [Caulobacter sp. 17J80-11]|uniref:response regulator n=1 Tax=Caulobacter sp. 17J80-11 TaxID=2763502 RepID=UPI0016535A3E|nr:response regulator [Caulobacter sp. 17J80-11]